LREVEKRRLFLARGFPSLFAYCREFLGYSEPEAMLRIQAMRLVREVPAVEEKIEKGELSLSVAALVQSAVRREEIPASGALKLVEDLSGASKREAERRLAELFPSAEKPERVREVNEERVEIRFTVSREEMALLERLLDRKAHTNFQRKYETLFLALAKAELERLEKWEAQPGREESGSKKNETLPEQAPCKKPPIPELAQRNSPVLPAEKPSSHQETRHIPNTLRRSVWLRDGGACQYIDPLTKRKCLSRHGVQLDHIKPFAQGGAHTKENLRLLCGAHNRWRSEAG
jgi:hypothetical protein